jgi:hypothetical protein
MRNAILMGLFLLVTSCASNREKSDRDSVAKIHEGLSQIQGIADRACRIYAGTRKIFVSPFALDSIDISERANLRACLKGKGTIIDTCTFRCDQCRTPDDCRCGGWIRNKDSTGIETIVFSNSECGGFPTVQSQHFILKRDGEKLKVDSLLRITSFQH